MLSNKLFKHRFNRKFSAFYLIYNDLIEVKIWTRQRKNEKFILINDEKSFLIFLKTILAQNESSLDEKRLFFSMKFCHTIWLRFICLNLISTQESILACVLAKT
jgi:hypothetical protein